MQIAERLALLQFANQDIRDLKANQWRFSNYGLLIQAALVASFTKLEMVDPLFRNFVLGLNSLTTLVVIIWLIHEAQDRIFRTRKYTNP